MTRPPPHTKIVFVECGCCGEYHHPAFHGECRDNATRFSTDYVDEIERTAGIENVEIITLDAQQEDQT